MPVESPMPLNCPSRPGWPSLKTTTPAAPAMSALRAFTTKSQVPRCTSAMPPAGKSAKSSGSHPLDELGSGVGGITTSTGTICPVAVPLTNGVNWLARDSYATPFVSSVRLDRSSVYVEVERLDGHVVASVSEDAHRILD